MVDIHIPPPLQARERAVALLWEDRRSGGWEVWQTSLHNPDFAAHATLCGATGIRVTDAAQLDDALAEALDHPGPSTVEILTDVELI